jgi:hypothetical protein
MITLRLSLLIVLTLLLGSCKDEGKEDILDVFDAYKAALRDKNGEAAVAVMDEKYFDDFQFILSAARTAPREKVFRMRPSERTRIVSLRNRLTPEELKALDARAAIKAIISRGNESSDLDIQLGRITFKHPRAFAPLWIEGIETKFRLEFIKANNIWKLDPACFDESLDVNLVKRAARINQREDAIILDRESQSSGKRVNDSVWDPPR